MLFAGEFFSELLSEVVILPSRSVRCLLVSVSLILRILACRFGWCSLVSVSMILGILAFRFGWCLRGECIHDSRDFGI